MGSSTKTVTGSQFGRLFEENGKPYELFTTRMAEYEPPRVVSGMEFDERVLSVFKYLIPQDNINAVDATISAHFVPSDAMEDSFHAGSAYTIEDSSSTSSSNEYIARAIETASVTSQDSVSIAAVYVGPSGDQVFDYTFSNGVTGTAPVAQASITKVSYELGGTIYTSYFFTDHYESDDDKSEIRYFIGFIKRDGESVDKRELALTTNLIGTTGASFEDVLDNEDVKDFSLTYCSPSDTQDIVSLYNSTNKSSFMIRMKNGATIRVYKSGANWRMKYNNRAVVKNEDGDEVVIVPLNFFDSISIVDKYMYIKEYLGFVSFSAVEVKVKFWQTGVFKFIFGIILFAVAIYTQQWWMLGLLTVSYALKAAGVNGFVVDAIVVVASAVATGGVSLIATLTFAISVVVEYVKIKTTAIIQQINELTQDERDLRRAVAERSRQYLYSPLAEYPDLTSKLYNAYNTSFSVSMGKYEYNTRNYFGY